MYHIRRPRAIVRTPSWTCGSEVEKDEIEKQVVGKFNEHMATVLDLLGYANLDHIWIERTKHEVS